MSWLELWEFVLALPYDSMTKSAMAGDHGRRRWTESDYMLRELLAVAQFQARIAWAGHHIEGKVPDLPLWEEPDRRSPSRSRRTGSLPWHGPNGPASTTRPPSPALRTPSTQRSWRLPSRSTNGWLPKKQRLPDGEGQAPPDN
ncbi:hypothetical protein SAV31267_036000 [Streptomyces avermitilis]|uniref:Uncharacterized protein n=1 Tax=Streptomyces avermitilis TaxID=33903 RepID=A0A4D4MRJ8_STRAX|nr:hypothetical protein SAV31267_036000 [Streptomyces avermitilis]